MPRWILFSLAMSKDALTFLLRPTTWHKAWRTTKRPLVAYGRLSTQTKLNWAWRGFEFVAIVAGITALWFSVISTQQSIEQTELSREAFIEQQKWGAWSVLSTDGANERATVYAIEKLVQLDQPIHGIDLSCQTSSEDIEAACPDRTQLLYMDLKATEYTWIKDFNVANRSININPKSVGFEDADFSGTNLQGDFSNVWLRDATFNDAILVNVLFYDAGFVQHVVRGSVVEKEFEDVRYHSLIDNVSFVGAELESVSFEGADVRLADFSNARMAWVDFGHEIRFEDPRIPQKIYLDSDARAFYTKPTINISGAVLCDTSKGSMDRAWVPCTYGLKGAIAGRMWYYEDQPPIGIELDMYNDVNIVACPPLNSSNTPPSWATAEFGPVNMRGYTCPSFYLDGDFS